MKVFNRKPFGNPKAKADITGVYEVLIPAEIWEKIVEAQKKHRKLTYSWIVRHMLFKLLKKKFFGKSCKVKKLIQEDKKYSKAKEDIHRFSLCLYGDDHIQLKIFSSILGISISRLVRVAIFWYIKEFDVERIPDIFEGAGEFRRFGKLSFEKIKKFGTKFVKRVEVKSEQENYFSVWTVSRSISFSESDIW